MGVDCVIKVDDKYTALDRWYVFSPCIKSGVIMSKSEALWKIRYLLRPKKINSETIVWAERQSEKIKYHMAWLMSARQAIKKGHKNSKIIFYPDYDTPDEYYHSFT